MNPLDCRIRPRLLPNYCASDAASWQALVIRQLGDFLFYLLSFCLRFWGVAVVW